MRLFGLVVLGAVTVAAAQVPILSSSSQSFPQPPRDVVRRAEPTGTARIKGRVVSADKGTPLRRANVTLLVVFQPPPMRSDAGDPSLSGARGAVPARSNQPPMAPRRATTNSDGQFEFSGLPAGTYRVSASPAQYSSQYLSFTFGATRASSMYWSEPGQSIELKDGESYDKAVIALPRGGVIGGRVTDENGDPLARVQVYTLAFPPGSSRGQRTGQGSMTDDLGQFRMWGLTTGDYLVVADARSNSYMGPNMPPETEEDRIGYVTTYYPGTLDEGSALRVRVKAGEELQGVDIRIAQARLFHVAGSVVDSKGRPVANGNVQLTARGGVNGSSGFFGNSDPKGQFQMRNIPPGDYRLVFRPPQNGPFSPDTPREPVEMAMVPVSIGGADLDNLLIVTSLGANVSGRVVFEDGPPSLPSPTPIRVMAVPLSLTGDFTGMSTPDPVILAADGTFTLKGLFGEHGLRVAVPNQFMKSVTVNGEDVTDTPHEFKASDRVTITVTSRASTLEGNVTDTREVQLPEAGVILFSEDKASWRMNSIRTRRASFDQNGHFRLPGLMPGRYYVAALPRQRLNFSPGGDTDVTFFEQLAKEATLVTIAADEQRTIDLRMLDAFARQ